MANELRSRPPATGCRRSARPVTSPPHRVRTGPDTVSHLDDDGRALWLTLTQDGPDRVAVTVFPYAGEFVTPQHVEVSGVRTILVPTPAGRYDFAVVSTAGLRREHRGSLATDVGAQVTSQVEVGARELRLALRNRGSDGLSYTVTPRDGLLGTAGITLSVGPGMTRSVAWDLTGSHGWYDVDVTVAEDPSFRRRLSGHVRRDTPPSRRGP